MNPKTYFKDSRDIPVMAAAKTVGAGRVILEVVEAERNRIRKLVEENPDKPETPGNLHKINALNWVLDLPRKADGLVNNFEEGE